MTGKATPGPTIYRCVGTDAYRFGGHRLCPNTQVRTDRLELAVWQEVCALLAYPERLAQEFSRRLHADGQGQRQERTALESQVGKLRQGLARLIDSYAEGLIEKQEFEPRVTRLRQRIAQVETQCQQLAEEETLQQELQLIVGRLDAFAAQVHQNLDELEWHRQREIIRPLVRRVEIGLDQIHVVFRVDAFAGEADSEKKSLQLCKRRNSPTTRKHSPAWIRRRYKGSATTNPQQGRKALSSRMEENKSSAPDHPLCRWHAGPGVKQLG